MCTGQMLTDFDINSEEIKDSRFKFILVEFIAVFLIRS